AEVALFRGVVLGVDEDGVIRAGGDAGLAADADRFVEVDDPVRPAVHRARRARRDARRVIALIAARDLKRAPRGGKRPDVDVLHVRAVHAERDFVLRLAGGRAGVAAD